MTEAIAAADTLECLQPNPGAPWVVATSSGFRLSTPDECSGPSLVETMEARSSAAGFRQMLAGCMASAWVDAGPALRQRPPPLSGRDGVLTYIYGLCGAYRTTHETPDVFRRARDRLRARGETEMADLAEEKAIEETGHDRLVLRDLAGFGLAAEALVDVVRPRRPLALLALFGELCDGDEPAAVFGYSYVLERLAAFRGQADIDLLQTFVKPGIDISRGARVHSGVGADAGHVEELALALCARPPAQRRAIASAVWRTARLQSDAGLEDYDAARFSDLLRAHGWKPEAVLAMHRAAS
jgi:hypothetical protein